MPAGDQSQTGYTEPGSPNKSLAAVLGGRYSGGTEVEIPQATHPFRSMGDGTATVTTASTRVQLESPPTATTLSSSPTAGATSFTVTSAAGLKAGRVAIIDTGASQESAWVTSVVGTTINVRDPLQNGHTAGATYQQTTRCQSVIVQARSTNQGGIVIGGPTVVAGGTPQTSRSGFTLSPGGSMQVDISDFSAVYVDAEYSGDVANFVVLSL